MSGTDPSELLERSLSEALDDVSHGRAFAPAGTAAALSAAFAASLVTMTARQSRTWVDAAGAIGQSEALRARLRSLIVDDAQAFKRARTLLLREGKDREHRGAARAPVTIPDLPPEQRDRELAEALRRAAEIPLTIAELAAEVAELAATVAREGAPDHRADAAAACGLAEAAVAAASHLVAVNLGIGPGDPFLRRAEDAVELAGAARRRTLAN